MDDYTDDAVLIPHETTYKGLADIQSFFTSLIAGLPEEGFDEAEEIHREEVEGEIAFLVWEAKPSFDFCTDTLVVRQKDPLPDVRITRPIMTAPGRR